MRLELPLMSCNADQRLQPIKEEPIDAATLEARGQADEEMGEEIGSKEESVVKQEPVDPQDRTVKHATEATRSEVKIESQETNTECPFAQYTLKEEEETPKNKKSNSGAMERASGSGGQANEESSLRMKVVGPGEKTVYVDVPFEGSPNGIPRLPKFLRI